ncbi:uncharacterized protein LOC108468658 [Gossypium arboreum]|uniref:uncharacterized protein LOC108468658 n=1 Tax=Gossypium arboreum TaxID=29729 RepID=UPI0022F1B942|nr:uncharacterized protein LOC108468658 [Gossypium arboreum]
MGDRGSKVQGGARVVAPEGEDDEAISGNNDENRQSFNTTAPGDCSSPDPGLGYGLHNFVLGTVGVPPQSVVDSNGVLIPNPEFLFHVQQDKLLASWLLSTVSDDVLVHLSGAKTSFEVWSIVLRRFTSKSVLAVSTLRHSLYSQKKGSLTVKEYLAKVQSLCDTLMAAGTLITEQEQVSIVLAGLPVEYESARVVASAMNVSLDLLADMLLDCESWQQDLASSIALQANIAQQNVSTTGNTGSSTKDFGTSYRGHVGPLVVKAEANVVSKQGLCSSNGKVWYPDSGASHHVTNDLDNLLESAPYIGTNKVFMGNGVPVSVAHTSSSCFTSATVCAAQLKSSVDNSCVFGFWHKRLGHPCNKTVMAILHKNNIAFNTYSISSEGHSYCVSFIDAYSHHTWMYLIKHKSEALEKFLQLQKLVAVQFGCSIKVNIPLRFWAHAFISVVYLINRLPTPVLYGMSPYEALHKTPPSFMHLRVFGCRCYPYLRPFNTHKLEYHSRPCVFLGYSLVHKGYKYMDDTGKLFVSRHVIFDEATFSFVTSASPAGSVSSVPSPQFQRHASQVPVVRFSSIFASSGSIDFQPLPATAVVSHDQDSSNQFSHSPQASGFSSSETSRVVSSNVQVNKSLHVPPINTHPIQTRAKSGIFKPCVFLTEIGVPKPVTIEEALSSKEWALVAKQKFDALIRNQTWDLVPLPTNRRAVGCKWVFKLKKHANGTIARYKGRLMVKGAVLKSVEVCSRSSTESQDGSCKRGSKKQKVVSRSTAEAEYRALAHIVTEVEKIVAGWLTVGHVPAQEQIADVFTKPLSAPLFTKFRSCLKAIAKHGQSEIAEKARGILRN